VARQRVRITIVEEGCVFFAVESHNLHLNQKHASNVLDSNRSIGLTMAPHMIAMGTSVTMTMGST
jgi:hypothetical protein